MLSPNVLGHRAALADIQAEIARFKTQSTLYISALEKEQEEIEAKLRAVVYPVLSLPGEITSRIFVECLPNDDVLPLAEHAPLLFLSVCHQWRDIAISTCLLWSSLRIESMLADNGIVVSCGTLRTLHTWFSRARALPLFLTMIYNISKVDLPAF
ncbi:hypothetical protein C8R45DRAFT_848908 [Mycena sanguinolenta]|nr:hypothetical protein C8R45DRAFT_848908 [Mycena sanguinolenta]